MVGVVETAQGLEQQEGGVKFGDVCVCVCVCVGGVPPLSLLRGPFICASVFTGQVCHVVSHFGCRRKS